MTIEGRDAARLNNFDLLRLAAAVAVLVSHSFALTGHVEPHIGAQNLGDIGVLVFFGISGFLVTRSWVRRPELRNFLAKRALRVFPALVVVLVISAAIVGPLVSTLPAHTYFSSSEPVTYVLKNLSMWTAVFTLPGVFPHLPYPHSVNGSLWTLEFEIRAYLIVAALGLVGVLRNRRAAVAGWVAIVLVVAAVPRTGQFLGNATFLRAFAVGSALYLFEGRLPWEWKWAALGIAIWVAASGTSAGPWLATVAIPYFAIVAAHRTPITWARVTRRGDFSYGIYLWAFLVQQLCAYAIPGITPLEMIAIALPVTYAIGAVSWFLVEQRALRLKPRPTTLLPEARPVAEMA